MTATCVAPSDKKQEKLLPLFHPPTHTIRFHPSSVELSFLKILVPSFFHPVFLLFFCPAFVWVVAVGKLFCCFLLSSLLFVMATPIHSHPLFRIRISSCYLLRLSYIYLGPYSHILAFEGQKPVVMNNEKAT